MARDDLREAIRVMKARDTMEKVPPATAAAHSFRNTSQPAQCVCLMKCCVRVSRSFETRRSGYERRW